MMDDSYYGKRLSIMFTKVFLILIVFYIFIGFLGIRYNKIDKNKHLIENAVKKEMYPYYKPKFIKELK